MIVKKINKKYLKGRANNKSATTFMQIERPMGSLKEYQNVEHKMWIGNLSGTYATGALLNMIGNFGLGNIYENDTTAGRTGKIIWIHSIRVCITMKSPVSGINATAPFQVDGAGTCAEVSVSNQYARLLIYKVKNCSLMSTTQNTPSGNVQSIQARPIGEQLNYHDSGIKVWEDKIISLPVKNRNTGAPSNTAFYTGSGHYKPIIWQKRFKKPWKVSFAEDANTSKIADGGFPEIQLAFYADPMTPSDFRIIPYSGLGFQDDKMIVRYDYQVVFSE